MGDEPGVRMAGSQGKTLYAKTLYGDDDVIERRRSRRFATAAVLAVSLVLTSASPATSHDVPGEAILHVFVKPEGNQLHVVVRVPLVLLEATDLPQRDPGYLELAEIDEPLNQAIRATIEQIDLFEDGTALTPSVLGHARIALPSDRSFASYAEALAHLAGPELPDDTNLYWNQGFFDAQLAYPIRSEASDFSLRVRLAPHLGDRLKTIVRFLLPSGTIRAYELIGQTDRVALDPRWHQAASTFVRSGFVHILGGVDHLLFLLCLITPLRRVRTLLVVVTSFTVAHSITLVAAAYSWGPSGAWFPPLVETLIAVSIVYMALENVFGASLQRRWLITFAFGLVHGFGFSFGLRETLQFAGSHLLVSLLSFNIGVELGQIAVLVLFVPALGILFRWMPAERTGIALVSVLVAHTAWHWMLERGAVLSRVNWPVPELLAAAATLIRLVLVLLVVGWAGWLLARLRWRRPLPRSPRADGELAWRAPNDRD